MAINTGLLFQPGTFSETECTAEAISMVFMSMHSPEFSFSFL